MDSLFFIYNTKIYINMITKQEDFNKYITEDSDILNNYPNRRDIIYMLRNNMVSRVNYPIISGYIIGSEAKGTARLDSDLDIGLIIPTSNNITSLKRTENYHSKFLNDDQKPKWNGRIIDFQFFYLDDQEFNDYNKIKIF